MSEDGEDEEETAAVEPLPPEIGELQLIELSVSTVGGASDPRTLKVRGSIGGVSVTVMVDCGATHNFIAPRVVKLLQLPISPTTNYRILIGNGQYTQSQGVCKDVQLLIGELVIVEEFLPLAMGSADVILGLRWLTSLGETRNDWSKLTMSFTVEGKTVTLEGDPDLHRPLVSLKSMAKYLQREEGVLLIECCSLSMECPDEGNSPTLPSDIEALLDAFSVLFEDPVGLPLSRGQEHAVVLQQGVSTHIIIPIHRKMRLSALLVRC